MIITSSVMAHTSSVSPAPRRAKSPKTMRIVICIIPRWCKIYIRRVSDYDNLYFDVLGRFLSIVGEVSPWLPSSVSETKVPETDDGPRTPSSGAQTPPRNAWLASPNNTNAGEKATFSQKDMF